MSRSDAFEYKEIPGLEGVSTVKKHDPDDLRNYVGTHEMAHNHSEDPLTPDERYEFNELMAKSYSYTNDINSLTGEPRAHKPTIRNDLKGLSERKMLEQVTLEQSQAMGVLGREINSYNINKDPDMLAVELGDNMELGFRQNKPLEKLLQELPDGLSQEVEASINKFGVANMGGMVIASPQPGFEASAEDLRDSKSVGIFVAVPKS